MPFVGQLSTGAGANSLAVGTTGKKVEKYMNKSSKTTRDELVELMKRKGIYREPKRRVVAVLMSHPHLTPEMAKLSEDAQAKLKAEGREIPRNLPPRYKPE